MDDFWSSFSRWFNEKTGSPLYFTYISFFIAWNWQFFQLIFLESPSLLNKPKIEYISENILIQFTHSAIPHFIVEFFETVANIIVTVGPPAFFTFLAIKYLPTIHKWALNIYLANHFERKKLYMMNKGDYEEWQLTKEREKEKRTQKLTQIKRDEAKQIETLTDEQKWELEYDHLNQTIELSEALKSIMNVIYNNSGMLYGMNNERNISVDDVALGDSKRLINIGENKTTIELTEKGKYFISRYTDSKRSSF